MRSAVSHQLSAISYQPSAISFEITWGISNKVLLMLIAEG
jgi:hypothetical protein